MVDAGLATTPASNLRRLSVYAHQHFDHRSGAYLSAWRRLLSTLSEVTLRDRLALGSRAAIRDALFEAALLRRPDSRLVPGGAESMDSSQWPHRHIHVGRAAGYRVEAIARRSKHMP